MERRQRRQIKTPKRFEDAEGKKRTLEEEGRRECRGREWLAHTMNLDAQTAVFTVRPIQASLMSYAYASQS
jgi:hypothetical protein